MPAIFAILLLCVPGPAAEAPLPAPQSDDALLFGITLDQAQACHDFNRECRDRAYQQWLLSGRNDYWGGVVVDLDRRGEAWQYLRSALSTENDSCRTYWLGWLRIEIGAMAYYQGAMPDHVNAAHFAEIP